MSDHEQVIAWLVPTATNSPADQATLSPENAFRTVPVDESSFFLTARLPHNLIASRPPRAIHLSFDQPPRRPGGSGAFILGTDPRSCDVVLPPLPGISPQHCCIRFDAESRLVVEDLCSERGTQVWFGWESRGDRVGHTWVLDDRQPGGCSPPRRVVLDVQGVRFQVVLNEHHDQHRAAYLEKVEAFCERPAWAEGLSQGWDRASLPPVPPLFDAAPVFQHILVKSLGEQGNSSAGGGEMYLWNVSRPWEPMIKAEVAAA